MESTLQNPALAAARTNPRARIITYWTIIAIGRGFDYYNQFREERVRAADLGRRLTEARLDALPNSASVLGRT